MAYSSMSYDGFSSGGGGGMGGVYGALIQYGLGEINREKQDRQRFINDFKAGLSDFEWIRQNYPNFFGIQSSYTPPQAYLNTETDGIGQMVDAVNIKRGEQAFNKWKMQKQREYDKEDQQAALDRIEALKNAGAWGGGNGGGYDYSKYGLE